MIWLSTSDKLVCSPDKHRGKDKRSLRKDSSSERKRQLRLCSTGVIFISGGPGGRTSQFAASLHRNELPLRPQEVGENQGTCGSASPFVLPSTTCLEGHRPW